MYQPIPASWPEQARRDLLEAVHEQAKKNLEDWTLPLRTSDVKHRLLVVEGAPAEALLGVTEDEHAVMIVVGRRGLGGFARLLMGSVSYRVVQESAIPVVVIPPAP